MEPLAIILVALLALACIVIAVLLVQRARFTERLAAARAERDALAAQHESRTSELAAEAAEARTRADASAARVAELSEELATLKERVSGADVLRQELERNEKRLREAFSALTAEAMKGNREEFMKQATPLLKPITETLDKTHERLTALSTRIDESKATSEGLRSETARLARALSRPEVRGQYGEIQLRRVAELAGMVDYCDFAEQTSVRDDAGNLKRPDLLVQLPNDRVVAVDAKCNTEPYMRAAEESDQAEREVLLDKFADGIARQAQQLARKGYWSNYAGSPDFVVMFIPGDQFLDTALSRRSSVLEEAAQQGVILASPATLIGLLRAIAVGWREHKLTEEAQALFTLGRELHERAAVMLEHTGSLGQKIGQAVKTYNQLVGSVDSRLIPTLRRFEDAGAKSAKELREPESVTIIPRELPQASKPDTDPA